MYNRGGANSFAACLGHSTIGHSSLSRRGTNPTPTINKTHLQRSGAQYGSSTHHAQKKMHILSPSLSLAVGGAHLSSRTVIVFSLLPNIPTLSMSHPSIFLISPSNALRYKEGGTKRAGKEIARANSITLGRVHGGAISKRIRLSRYAIPSPHIIPEAAPVAQLCFFSSDTDACHSSGSLLGARRSEKQEENKSSQRTIPSGKFEAIYSQTKKRWTPTKKHKKKAQEKKLQNAKQHKHKKQSKAKTQNGKKDNTSCQK